MIRRYLLFASLAVLAAFSAIPSAFSTDLLTIERADAATLAVPWTDVNAAVVPDTVQVDTPRRLDAFGAIYERFNQPGQTWRDAVECYQHIDPGRSFA